MISERLKRQIARQKAEGVECYLIMELDPDTALMLIVPRGARNGDVLNPMSEHLDPCKLPDCDGVDDWGRVTRPMLMWLSPPDGEPDLRVVPDPPRPAA